MPEQNRGQSAAGQESVKSKPEAAISGKRTEEGKSGTQKPVTNKGGFQAGANAAAAAGPFFDVDLNEDSPEDGDYEIIDKPDEEPVVIDRTEAKHSSRVGSADHEYKYPDGFGKSNDGKK